MSERIKLKEENDYLLRLINSINEITINYFYKVFNGDLKEFKNKLILDMEEIHTRNFNNLKNIIEIYLSTY